MKKKCVSIVPSMQFKGKTFVRNHHLTCRYQELRPVFSEGASQATILRDNLVIHGDNLPALKAPLPIYYDKVKCIYIFRPYNTGNEGWPTTKTHRRCRAGSAIRWNVTTSRVTTSGAS